MFNSHKAETGFTLLELLVVLVILGLIAAVAGPQVMKMLGNAKSDVARIQMENIRTALDFFNLDMGRYPSGDEGLEILIKRPDAGSRWAGPYLKSKIVPMDPWSRAYIYENPGKDNKPYELKSLGADGTIGGTSENADIILK